MRLTDCFGRALALGASFVAPLASADGPGFSGITATADSADTAVSNPAGMSRIDSPEFASRTVLAAAVGTFDVDERKSTISGGDPQNDVSPVLVPAFFYVRPLDDRWRLGFSLTVPTGFGAEYGDDWAGRYYSNDFALVYVSLTPAVSYRIDDRLSVGLAVNVNYTASSTKVSVNALAPDVPDGRLKTELDGVGTSFSLSALWEVDERTRFGLVYTSEAKADLEGTLKFRNTGPLLTPLLEQKGLLGADIKVENILPQRVVAGAYHEFQSGSYVTLDALWMDFSKFATGSVSIEGDDLHVDDGGGFKDFWGASLGVAFPTHANRTFSLGAFYVSPPVSDAKRSLAFALDRIFGAGAGVSFARSDGRKIDVNLNLIDYGQAPVDTGPAPVRGRVVGRNDNPYAVAIDFAFQL